MRRCRPASSASPGGRRSRSASTRSSGRIARRSRRCRLAARPRSARRRAELSISVPRQIGAAGSAPGRSSASPPLNWIALGDAGALGIAAGEVDHAERQVAGEDRHRRRVHARLGAAAQALHLGAQLGARERQQALEGEAAQRARRRCRRRSAPPRWRSCPSRSTDRAGRRRSPRCRASPPRRASPRPASPSSGASPVSLAPAALEQRLARAVDVDLARARADVQHDRQVGSLGVDVRPLAGGFAQLIADRVLDPQRGEVEALAAGCVCAVRVDPERLPRRDPVAPSRRCGRAA